MSTQICIINPKGATLRSGPGTSGGVIRPVKHGEVLVVEAIVPTPGGDLWVKAAGMFTYGLQQVPGYVAQKVAGVTYGVLIDQPEPSAGEYKRGWNECLDEVHTAMVKLRK